MKVKIAFGSDIRRWYAPEENRYEALLHFIYQTFNFPDAGEFYLQFEDDEGDRMTLSSEGELNDAFVLAEQEERKSLKIFLIPVSIENAQQEALSQFGGSSRSIAGSLDEFEVVSNPRSHADSSVSSSIEVPELAESPVEEDAPRTWQEEMKDFLSDEVVNVLLPDFVREVMILLRNDETLDVAVLQTSSRLEFEAIDQHPFFSGHVKPHLDVISLRATALLPVLLAFDNDHIASLVPQLVDTATQMMSGVENAELDVAPIFATLFPTWMAMMNANHPHGATIDLARLFGCHTAAEAAESMTKPDVAEQIVHRGITCDMCNTGPIVGVRYKCCVCSDFDLCGTCEATHTHNANHPLLKLNRPRRGLPRGGMPGLREMFGRGRCGWRKFHHGHEHHGHHGPWGRWGHWGQWDAEETPTGCGRSTARKETGHKLKAHFVEDVSVPDRSYYNPGLVLEKIWRIKNTGQGEWGNDCSLVFVKGCRDMTMEERFPVPNAAPGEVVNVAAMIRTPNTEGRYCAYYRFENNGVKFGPRVWVDIFVTNDESKVGEANFSRRELKQMHRQEKLERRQEKLTQRREKVQAELANLNDEILATTQPEGPRLSCVCGATLVKMHHKKAYGRSARIHCDVCGRLARKADKIYHCQNELSDLHPTGYDLCEGCGDDQLNLVEVEESIEVKDQDVNEEIPSVESEAVEFDEPNATDVNGDPSQVEAAVESGFPFQSALEAVMEMGFEDEESIKQLLIETNGDAEAVVWLLFSSA